MVDVGFLVGLAGFIPDEAVPMSPLISVDGAEFALVVGPRIPDFAV